MYITLYIFLFCRLDNWPMDNSPHGQLAPWTTRPMDNSPQGQLAPWQLAPQTTRPTDNSPHDNSPQYLGQKIEGVYYITLLTHFAASLFSIHWFALHYYADQANIAWFTIYNSPHDNLPQYLWQKLKVYTILLYFSWWVATWDGTWLRADLCEGQQRRKLRKWTSGSPKKYKAKKYYFIRCALLCV